MSEAGYTLVCDCPDRAGVVASVSAFVAERAGLILEAQHFREPIENRSYMRTVFTGDALPSLDAIKAEFTPLADQFDMRWSIWPSDRKCKALIAVSKQGHCLSAMLHRWHDGALPIDIAGVVSNHDDQRALSEFYGLDYHHLPIDGDKADQEKRILEIFESTGAELMVLARYMQILTARMCDALAGRCINIHHSFLPGFKGARPYHQAYERGVKIIGATAHYVTADLDEGPIIEQAVERVDHTVDPKRLAEMGNDIESVVLIRAVRWHAEHRVFLNGRRTVVLR
ncbi:MAG: formyltetrahydrofolate deformylase [Pseudomonadota bacterium]